MNHWRHKYSQVRRSTGTVVRFGRRVVQLPGSRSTAVQRGQSAKNASLLKYMDRLLIRSIVSRFTVFSLKVQIQRCFIDPVDKEASRRMPQCGESPVGLALVYEIVIG